jgi:DMSO/TMAO reductase YedYZ molybdopterin-dependent catalytic subunit
MDAGGFADYRLLIGGLVTRPVSLSLEQLRALGQQTQIVKHNCIQGWNAIAEWAGVPMNTIIDLVGPMPEAQHVVFYARDDKASPRARAATGSSTGRSRCIWPANRRPSWPWR